MLNLDLDPFNNDPSIPAHRLRAFIRQHLAGQCKILSEGDACTCALCDLDRLYVALRWYEDEARACAKNSHSGRHEAGHALLASITVLANDGGKRSIDVLGPLQLNIERGI